MCNIHSTVKSSEAQTSLSLITLVVDCISLTIDKSVVFSMLHYHSRFRYLGCQLSLIINCWYVPVLPVKQPSTYVRIWLQGHLPWPHRAATWVKNDWTRLNMNTGQSGRGKGHPTDHCWPHPSLTIDLKRLDFPWSYSLLIHACWISLMQLQSNGGRLICANSSYSFSRHCPGKIVICRTALVLAISTANCHDVLWCNCPSGKKNYGFIDAAWLLLDAAWLRKNEPTSFAADQQLSGLWLIRNLGAGQVAYSSTCRITFTGLHNIGRVPWIYLQFVPQHPSWLFRGDNGT